MSCITRRAVLVCNSISIDAAALVATASLRSSANPQRDHRRAPLS
jgi:hypothetical protein